MWLSNQKTLKSVPREVSKELKNIKWWELKSIKDLILKFYNCTFQYLDLLEWCYDGEPIFNWRKLYSILNEMELRRPMFFKHLNLVKHSKDSQIDRNYLTSLFVKITKIEYLGRCVYTL